MSFLTTMVDFIGYLGNSFFLQSFGYIDQFGGITGIAGFIEIAYGADTQDLVPLAMFLQYFQHFFLLQHFFQFARIGTVGHLKQQTIVIFHQVEQMEISGTWQ